MVLIFYLGLVPAQDVHFLYARSHLSALQNCSLLFSTNFQFILIFKRCITQCSHWILSCTFFVSKNIVQSLMKTTHSFVAIELLTFCKNSQTILLLKRALTILAKKNNIPYVERGLPKKLFSTFIKTYYLSFFDFRLFPQGRDNPNIIFW